MAVSVRVRSISLFITHPGAASRMYWRTTAQSMTRCNPIQIVLTHGSPSLLRAKKPPSMARPEWGNCYDPAALAAGSDDCRRVQRAGPRIRARYRHARMLWYSAGWSSIVPFTTAVTARRLLPRVTSRLLLQATAGRVRLSVEPGQHWAAQRVPPACDRPE